ncbi:MAG: YcxB family protein [Clostridia bacterium]|nr:YcxB family protein [Clostridia bacterium]
MIENSENKALSLRYDLSEQEVAEALKTIRFFKTDKRKIIYTAIFTLCALVNGFFYFDSQRSNGMLLFLAVLCLVFIAVIWLTPAYFIRQISARNAGADVTASFDEKAVTLTDSRGEKNFVYSDCELSETDNLFVLTDSAKDIFVLPKRLCDSDQAQRIRDYFA